MAQFAQRVAVMRSGQLLEINGVREIFARPEHPYTKLLMESLPSINRKESLLSTLRLAQTVGVDSLDGAKLAEQAAVETEP
jgi:peptide/nickel transport system ATP-binding protein